MRKILLLLFCINFLQAGIYAENSDTSRSNDINQSNIKATLKKVADWQIEHIKYSMQGSAGHLHDYGINAWTNAVLYSGMLEWARIADENTYKNWLYDIGEKSNWAIAENFANYSYKLYHADELCIGQFFIEMYKLYEKPELLESTQTRVDWIINNPPNDSLRARHKQSWTWCDALYMAPPVYAQLASLTQDGKYLEFMDKQFKQTYEYLFDKEEKLFFRDDSYFNKQEKNGKKVFWGRGNAWVVGGLVNILKYLPQDSPYRPFYENLFKEFVPQLITLQDSDGYWHASLLDPVTYPFPETSATALISYAVAYGINTGLLDKEKYLPSLNKAWIAVTKTISEDGKVGWIQPIGANPAKVTADMTAVYGVGAVLMLGSEIYKMVE